MPAERCTRQIVVFSLDQDEYAVPIDAVQEIIRFDTPRDVGSPDPTVRGVISLRGTIMPVIDLAARLGHRPVTPSKIVVLAAAGRHAGMMVSDVSEVLAVTDSQIEPAPDISGPQIDAVARVDGRMIVVLGAEQLATVDVPAL